MKKNSGKAVIKPDRSEKAGDSGKPGPRQKFSSPPCYAHEFPGYFGEIEEGGSKQQPPKKENV